MPSARGKFVAHKARKNFNKSVRRKPLQLSLFKIIVLGVLLFSTGFIGKNLYTSWQNKIWNLNNRITVVVASKSPKIYSFNPQTGKMVEFVIPESTQIETAGGYGKWMAASLWDLGAGEKKGGELLKLSLQKSLGIPVDAYVEEAGVSLFTSRSLGFIYLESNLTFFDRINLLLHASGTKLADRREIDLVSAGVLVKTKLPDGVEGYTIIPERVKSVLEFLRDDLVSKEEKRVVVANASGRGGLATQVAQIGSVLGARVIGAQTSNEDIENCKVRGKLVDLESVTAHRLLNIFDCEKETSESRGPEDLELILGKKFVERF